MENPFPEIAAESAGLLSLGVVLGESLAFGVVSGRIAAAQAACLQRLRDEKLFHALEPTWETFCPKHLRISRAGADRTIRLWQEFGAGYFEMAALTRVSAETYRAIAPAVKDGVLHVDGEAIPLNAENSRRVSAGVARLRSVMPPRTARSKSRREIGVACRVQDMKGRFRRLIVEFRNMARVERDGRRWNEVADLADSLIEELNRIARGAF